MTVTSQFDSAKNCRGKRAGLTLIELVIVLFILAAIAGISLTYFGSFQKLTHGSTSAAALRAGQTSIALNFIRRGQLGDGFDNLVDTAGAVPGWIANSAGLVPVALDADQVDALGDVGIVNVLDATAGVTENVTFEGHGTPEALIVGSTVGELTAAAATATSVNFNFVDGSFDNIFAFGIGESCSLVGINGSFQEAPVHTPGEGSAFTTYGRYVILVGYESPATTGGEPAATYLGITCIDDGENFNNINRNLSEYLEAGE